MSFSASDSRLTAPQAQPEDKAETSLRPLALDDFIGQEDIKANLRIFLSAAKARGEALDHVLLSGPPGLGKTTLAQIVAKEMGVNFRATSGPILTRAGDLAALLTSLEKGDVLFIDEIHRLSAPVEEVLYPAMEDFKLDIMIGEGAGARALRIDLPRFTLVGATTRLGLIANPLRDRFGIPLALQFYDPAALRQVIARACQLLHTVIKPDAAEIVARRARGTPRIAVRLVKRVRDFAHAEGKESVDTLLVQTALEKLGVDALGLDGADRRYLSFIAEHYGGGPVGIDTIAAGLSEQRDSIEETIEPFLIQLGFLHRTPRGRVMTPKGFTHLGLTAPSPPGQMELLEGDLSTGGLED